MNHRERYEKWVETIYPGKYDFTMRRYLKGNNSFYEVFTAGWHTAEEPPEEEMAELVQYGKAWVDSVVEESKDGIRLEEEIAALISDNKHLYESLNGEVRHSRDLEEGIARYREATKEARDFLVTTFCQPPFAPNEKEIQVITNLNNALRLEATP